jgi:hypothetical protein
VCKILYDFDSKKHILHNCFSAYVGLATVAGFVWWFVYSDNGPHVPYSELVYLIFLIFLSGTLTYFL